MQDAFYYDLQAADRYTSNCSMRLRERSASICVDGGDRHVDEDLNMFKTDGVDGIIVSRRFESRRGEVLNLPRPAVIKVEVDAVSQS